MIAMLLAIAPIFVLIILGHALRRGGIPSLEFWNLNDKLVYWVLFPALLFHKMATMDLTGADVGRIAMVVYPGLAVAVFFVLVMGAIFTLGRPAWTSVLQGCARHNTFIALAVAERVFGAEGLAVAALCTALMVPVTNVTIVTLMPIMLHEAAGGRLLRSIVRELGRNPLLIAVLMGWGVNLAGIDDIPVLMDVARILGAAALPIVLLCVGANLRVREMAAAVSPIGLALAGKLLVGPAVALAFAAALELDRTQTLVVLLFGAVPTSASTYTLARQMGGDAPVMAAIVTIQTIVAFVSLPLMLLAADRWISW